MNAKIGEQERRYWVVSPNVNYNAGGAYVPRGFVVTYAPPAEQLGIGSPMPYSASVFLEATR